MSTDTTKMPPAVAAAIGSLQARANQLERNELARLFRRNPTWSDESKAHIEGLMDRVLTQLLTPPIETLKQTPHERPHATETEGALNHFRSIFDLT